MRRKVRNVVDQHQDWFNQVEADGPFLALPVIRDIWPQGVERLGDTDDRMVTFKQAYLQWQRAFDMYAASTKTDEAEAKYDAVNGAWIELVLDQLAGWQGLRISADDPRLADVRIISPGGEITVRPNGALEGKEADFGALVLVGAPTTDLRAKGLDGWAASEIDRMAMLLRKARVEVGIVTDGQWWAIVWAKDGKPTGSGMVNALTWAEEPLVRDAFLALIDQRRFRARDTEQRLPRLFERSELEAEQITEALGTQVRKSVELLVQAFSEARLTAAERGDPDPLTEKPDDIYQAAVTIMMRVVFLLFAEERAMLPTEQLYWDSYAVSQLLDELRQAAADGEEHLDENYDVWHRLLAVSEALFAGVNYDEMRMPAYGGSLLDPARFPWLHATDSRGLRLKVSDRVMLHVLESVQTVVAEKERRRISFREIDVEQIGYIYEGLLGYTCRTVDGDVVLGLVGTDGEEPEIRLGTLREMCTASTSTNDFATKLVAWVKKNQPAATGKTINAIAKIVDSGLTKDEEADLNRLLTPIAGHDPDLLAELVSWGKLIRRDLRGIPYVVPVGGVVVAETPSRRHAGAHYTPRSLAEEVVKHALEPLVYEPGPLHANDETAWTLKSSTAILELKVADIAAGSGAFLVAAARFLADRVTEAWTEEGRLSLEEQANPRLANDRAIRNVIARCLYGADINPTAVEMCKLSLWLVSMDKTKPFSFVDDKIFCGNSLLGVTSLDQLQVLHIHPDPQRGTDLAHELLDVDGKIAEATRLRNELASPVDEHNPMRSMRGKIALLEQAIRVTADLRLIANGIIATGLPLGGRVGTKLDDAYRGLRWELAEAFPAKGLPGTLTKIEKRIDAALTPTVETDYDRWRPLHWVLEAPDVFVEHGGFDAVVGNPPFLAGKKIAIAYGVNIESWVKSDLKGQKGSADLCAHFIRRAWNLLRADGGTVGLIGTDRVGQGDTAAMSGQVLAESGVIFRATSKFRWPGKASTGAAIIWAASARSRLDVDATLDGKNVRAIKGTLVSAAEADVASARQLVLGFPVGRGVQVYGEGFILEADDPLLNRLDPQELEYIRPFVNGQSLMSGKEWGRVAIDVGRFATERELQAAAPNLAAHLRQSVKPIRDRITSQIHEARYWAYWDKREALFREIARLDRFLVTAMDTRVPVFIFTRDKDSLYSHKVAIVATASDEAFGVLSSSAHYAWFERTRTGRGSTSNYVISRCLRTFPFPTLSTDSLRAAAIEFNQARDQAISQVVSPTKLYNDIDSPRADEPPVVSVREAQVKLDRAVFDAYEWFDIELDHDFYSHDDVRRWTLSPRTRAQIVRRLLDENHRQTRGSRTPQGNGGTL